MGHVEFTVWKADDSSSVNEMQMLAKNQPAYFGPIQKWLVTGVPTPIWAGAAAGIGLGAALCVVLALAKPSLRNRARARPVSNGRNAPEVQEDPETAIE